ncbi:MAG: sensor histidine kinase [Caulobacteraceae bacterium]
MLTRRADGVIRVGNRAARLLFGTDDRLLAPPQALVDALSATHAEPTTLSLATQAGPRGYAISITDLADPVGVVRLAVLIDIQADLRAAEAATLRDLLQVLSHEIMNALTPVASLAATALDLLADASPASTLLARDAVETLARRAGGLARFVEAYRVLARLPPPDLQPTHLVVLIDEAARLFRSRWSIRGVTLQVEGPRNNPSARLDMDLMVHALLNVLSNAAEAALDEQNQPPLVTLSVAVSISEVTISVTDSGVGVAPALREQVFQPFYTTKSEGTGVGLSFARQVALSHGGDLVLQAAQGDEGATFTFIIDR